LGFGRGQKKIRRGLNNNQANNFSGRGRKILDRNLPYLPVAQIFKPNGIPASELNYIQLNLDD
jgi:hypothetical protein